MIGLVVASNGVGRAGGDMQAAAELIEADGDAPLGRPIAPPLYLLTTAVSGASQGFVTVTLGYVLSQHGFSVAAIGALIGLRLLPETWRVLIGPLLDLSFNARFWYLVGAIAVALCTALFAILPLDPAYGGLFSLLALALGISANICIVAQTTGISITTPVRTRGKIAGWTQAGTLGGVGLGGGLGLWLASHFGMSASALGIALLLLACATPMLTIRTPRPAAAMKLPAVCRELGREIASLIASRAGLLSILAVTLPMGLGAFTGLLSSVAGDWHASADLTASTSGVLAGLASVPGCLIGGRLCDRHDPRIVLAWSGLACALGEAMMAFGPRTPDAFVAFTLLNNVLLGVAYAAVAGVVYVALKSVSGGTIGALLGSLCNVPLVTMTVLLGNAAAHYGSTGMMAIEATLGVGASVFYGLIAILWRRPMAAPVPA